MVVPLYNHVRYIAAALESVLAQTSSADEILLIDDGSSDGGIVVAERVLAGHPNTRVYRQPNRGAHETINTLVRISRSDWVAVLNSDDIFLPTKLARCRELIARNPGASLICGGIVLFDDKGRDILEGVEIDWFARARAFRDECGLPQLALMNENWVATTSNMVFTRSLWHAADGFQNLRYCHDFDFLMTAFACTEVLIDDTQAHIRYRVHSSNTIKENGLDVRLELAAAIAAALCGNGHRLLGVQLDGSAIRSFRIFLRNKGFGELITLLQTLRPGFVSRAEFYAFVRQPGRREALIELLLD